MYKAEDIRLHRFVALKFLPEDVAHDPQAVARFLREALHQGARRVQTITCNVQERGVDSYVDEARKRISRLSFPAATCVEFSGTAAAQAQSRHDLLLDSLLAGLGIVLLLSIVMGNYRNLLLVLANLPFALVGGVLAGLFTGGNLSLGSLVGFVLFLESLCAIPSC